MNDPTADASAPASPPGALILAAGRGSRLKQYTLDLPKCLLRVGERTILEHQIRALRLAGVTDIQVVTGYRSDLVETVCGGSVSYAHNAAYESTNSFDSFGCSTLEPDENGLLVLNSDVLFHPGLLVRLLNAPDDNALLADFRATLAGEEMKIAVDPEGRITAISKKMDPAGAHAENLGVLRLGRGAARRMLELARSADARNTGLAWVPDGIHFLRREFVFRAVSVSGLPWTEIDFEEDLHRARNEVYPLIHEALWGPDAVVAREARGT